MKDSIYCLLFTGTNAILAALSSNNNNNTIISNTTNTSDTTRKMGIVYLKSKPYRPCVYYILSVLTLLLTQTTAFNCCSRYNTFNNKNTIASDLVLYDEWRDICNISTTAKTNVTNELVLIISSGSCEIKQFQIGDLPTASLYYGIWNINGYAIPSNGFSLSSGKRSLLGAIVIPSDLRKLLFYSIRTTNLTSDDSFKFGDREQVFRLLDIVQPCCSGKYGFPDPQLSVPFTGPIASEPPSLPSDEIKMKPPDQPYILALTCFKDKYSNRSSILTGQHLNILSVLLNNHGDFQVSERVSTEPSAHTIDQSSDRIYPSLTSSPNMIPQDNAETIDLVLINSVLSTEHSEQVYSNLSTVSNQLVIGAVLIIGLCVFFQCDIVLFGENRTKNVLTIVTVWGLFSVLLSFIRLVISNDGVQYAIVGIAATCLYNIYHCFGLKIPTENRDICISMAAIACGIYSLLQCLTGVLLVFGRALYMRISPIIYTLLSVFMPLYSASNTTIRFLCVAIAAYGLYIGIFRSFMNSNQLMYMVIVFILFGICCALRWLINTIYASMAMLGVGIRPVEMIILCLTLWVGKHLIFIERAWYRAATKNILFILLVNELTIISLSWLSESPSSQNSCVVEADEIPVLESIGDRCEPHFVLHQISSHSLYTSICVLKNIHDRSKKINISNLHRILTDAIGELQWNELNGGFEACQKDFIGISEDIKGDWLLQLFGTFSEHFVVNDTNGNSLIANQFTNLMISTIEKYPSMWCSERFLVFLVLKTLANELNCTINVYFESTNNSEEDISIHTTAENYMYLVFESNSGLCGEVELNLFYDGMFFYPYLPSPIVSKEIVQLLAPFMKQNNSVGDVSVSMHLCLDPKELCPEANSIDLRSILSNTGLLYSTWCLSNQDAATNHELFTEFRENMQRLSVISQDGCMSILNHTVFDGKTFNILEILLIVINNLTARWIQTDNQDSILNDSHKDQNQYLSKAVKNLLNKCRGSRNRPSTGILDLKERLNSETSSGTMPSSLNYSSDINNSETFNEFNPDMIKLVDTLKIILEEKLNEFEISEFIVRAEKEIVLPSQKAVDIDNINAMEYFLNIFGKNAISKLNECNSTTSIVEILRIMIYFTLNRIDEVRMNSAAFTKFELMIYQFLQKHEQMKKRSVLLASLVIRFSLTEQNINIPMNFNDITLNEIIEVVIEVFPEFNEPFEIEGLTYVDLLQQCNQGTLLSYLPGHRTKIIRILNEFCIPYTFKRTYTSDIDSDRTGNEEKPPGPFILEVSMVNGVIEEIMQCKDMLDKDIGSCTEIRIFCSDILYVCSTSATYTLTHSSRNVVICAKQIITLTADGVFTVDVSGFDGKNSFDPTEFPTEGMDGRNGANGEHAGNILISLDNHGEPSCPTITLLANGGKGAAGQNGKAGIHGNNGKDGYFPPSQPNKASLDKYLQEKNWVLGWGCRHSECGTKGTKGTNGGNGGNAGCGGKGGSAGKVEMRKYSDFDVEISNKSGTAGEHGIDGIIGSPGKGGKHGRDGPDVSILIQGVWFSQSFSNLTVKSNIRFKDFDAARTTSTPGQSPDRDVLIEFFTSPTHLPYTEFTPGDDECALDGKAGNVCAATVAALSVNSINLTDVMSSLSSTSITGQQVLSGSADILDKMNLSRHRLNEINNATESSFQVQLDFTQKQSLAPRLQCLSLNTGLGENIQIFKLIGCKHCIACNLCVKNLVDSILEARKQQQNVECVKKSKKNLIQILNKMNKHLTVLVIKLDKMVYKAYMNAIYELVNLLISNWIFINNPTEIFDALWMNIPENFMHFLQPIFNICYAKWKKQVLLNHFLTQDLSNESIIEHIVKLKSLSLHSIIELTDENYNHIDDTVSTDIVWEGLMWKEISEDSILLLLDKSQDSNEVLQNVIRFNQNPSVVFLQNVIISLHLYMQPTNVYDINNITIQMKFWKLFHNWNILSIDVFEILDENWKAFKLTGTDLFMERCSDTSYTYITQWLEQHDSTFCFVDQGFSQLSSSTSMQLLVSFPCCMNTNPNSIEYTSILLLALCPYLDMLFQATTVSDSTVSLLVQFQQDVYYILWKNYILAIPSLSNDGKQRILHTINKTLENITGLNNNRDIIDKIIHLLRDTRCKLILLSLELYTIDIEASTLDENLDSPIALSINKWLKAYYNLITEVHPPTNGEVVKKRSKKAVSKAKCKFKGIMLEVKHSITIPKTYIDACILLRYIDSINQNLSNDIKAVDSFVFHVGNNFVMYLRQLLPIQFPKESSELPAFLKHAQYGLRVMQDITKINDFPVCEEFNVLINRIGDLKLGSTDATTILPLELMCIFNEKDVIKYMTTCYHLVELQDVLLPVPIAHNAILSWISVHAPIGDATALNDIDIYKQELYRIIFIGMTGQLLLDNEGITEDTVTRVLLELKMNTSELDLLSQYSDLSKNSNESPIDTLIKEVLRLWKQLNMHESDIFSMLLYLTVEQFIVGNFIDTIKNVFLTRRGTVLVRLLVNLYRYLKTNQLEPTVVSSIKPLLQSFQLPCLLHIQNYLDKVNWMKIQACIQWMRSNNQINLNEFNDVFWVTVTAAELVDNDGISLLYASCDHFVNYQEVNNNNNNEVINEDKVFHTIDVNQQEVWKCMVIGYIKVVISQLNKNSAETTPSENEKVLLKLQEKLLKLAQLTSNNITEASALFTDRTEAVNWKINCNNVNNVFDKERVFYAWRFLLLLSETSGSKNSTSEHALSLVVLHNILDIMEVAGNISSIVIRLEKWYDKPSMWLDVAMIALLAEKYSFICDKLSEIEISAGLTAIHLLEEQSIEIDTSILPILIHRINLEVLEVNINKKQSISRVTSHIIDAIIRYMSRCIHYDALTIESLENCSLLLWENLIKEQIVRNYVKNALETIFEKIPENLKNYTMEYFFVSIYLTYGVDNFEPFMLFLEEIFQKIDINEWQQLFYMVTSLYYQRITLLQVRIIIEKSKSKHWEKEINKIIADEQHNSIETSVTDILMGFQSKELDPISNISWSKSEFQEFESLLLSTQRWMQSKDIITYNSSIEIANITSATDYGHTRKTKELHIFNNVSIVLKCVLHQMYVCNGKIAKITQLTTIALALYLAAIENSSTDITKRIALVQLKTGEGKTLIVACIAALKAIAGYHVHVVTSNRDLAQSAADEHKKFFKALNLNAHCNCRVYRSNKGGVMPVTQVGADYQKNHIIYGDISSFERDYLMSLERDSDLYGKYFVGSREDSFLIVDEVDFMAIDKCLSTLYLSTKIPIMKTLETLFINIAAAASQFQCSDENEKIEKIEGIKEIILQRIHEGTIEVSAELIPLCESQMITFIESAIIAIRQMEPNTSFVFRDGKIVIMDTNSGIEEYSSRWTNGLSCFLDIFYRQEFVPEAIRANFISHKTFFELYGANVFGMTGTLGNTDTRSVMNCMYPATFVDIPRQYKSKFTLQPPKISTDKKDWLKTIVIDAMEKIKSGRVVLVVSENISISKEISAALSATMHTESELTSVKVLQYWEDGDEKTCGSSFATSTIIVSTNKGGRGTDIKLEQSIILNGGLHVIMTFHPESERNALQAFGRAGRNGEPGSGRFVLNVDPSYSRYEYLQEYSEFVLELEKYRFREQEKRGHSKLLLESLPEMEIEDALLVKYRQFREKLSANLPADILKEVHIWVMSRLQKRFGFFLMLMKVKSVSKEKLYYDMAMSMFDKEFNEVLLEQLKDITGIIECNATVEERVQLGRIYLFNKNFKTAFYIFQKLTWNCSITDYFAVSPLAYCVSMFQMKELTINGIPMKSLEKRKHARTEVKKSYRRLQALLSQWSGSNEAVKYISNGHLYVEQHIGDNNQFEEQCTGKMDILSGHIQLLEEALGKTLSENCFEDLSCNVSSKQSKEMFQLLLKKGILSDAQVVEDAAFVTKKLADHKSMIFSHVFPSKEKQLREKLLAYSHDITRSSNDSAGVTVDLLKPYVYNSHELLNCIFSESHVYKVYVVVNSASDDIETAKQILELWQELHCTHPLIYPAPDATIVIKIRTLLPETIVLTDTLPPIVVIEEMIRMGTLQEVWYASIEHIQDVKHLHTVNEKYHHLKFSSLGSIAEVNESDSVDIDTYIGNAVDAAKNAGVTVITETSLFPFRSADYEAKRLLTLLSGLQLIESCQVHPNHAWKEYIQGFNDSSTEDQFLEASKVALTVYIKAKYKDTETEVFDLVKRRLVGVIGSICNDENKNMSCQFIPYTDKKVQEIFTGCKTLKQLPYFADLGLDQFFIWETERKWFDWRVMTVALLGAAQLIAGIICIVLAPATGGALLAVGKFLIGEGLNDLLFAMMAQYSGKFSWQNYAIQKVISIAVQLICVGAVKVFKRFTKLKAAAAPAVEGTVVAAENLTTTAASTTATTATTSATTTAVTTTTSVMKASTVQIVLPIIGKQVARFLIAEAADHIMNSVKDSLLVEAIRMLSNYHREYLMENLKSALTKLCQCIPNEAVIYEYVQSMRDKFHSATQNCTQVKEMWWSIGKHCTSGIQSVLTTVAEKGCNSEYNANSLLLVKNLIKYGFVLIKSVAYIYEACEVMKTSANNFIAEFNSFVEEKSKENTENSSVGSLTEEQINSILTKTVDIEVEIIHEKIKSSIDVAMKEVGSVLVHLAADKLIKAMGRGANSFIKKIKPESSWGKQIVVDRAKKREERDYYKEEKQSIMKDKTALERVIAKGWLKIKNHFTENYYKREFAVRARESRANRELGACEEQYNTAANSIIMNETDNKLKLSMKLVSINGRDHSIVVDEHGKTVYDSAKHDIRGLGHQIPENSCVAASKAFIKAANKLGSCDKVDLSKHLTAHSVRKEESKIIRDVKRNPIHRANLGKGNRIGVTFDQIGLAVCYRYELEQSTPDDDTEKTKIRKLKSKLSNIIHANDIQGNSGVDTIWDEWNDVRKRGLGLEFDEVAEEVLTRADQFIANPDKKARSNRYIYGKCAVYRYSQYATAPESKQCHRIIHSTRVVTDQDKALIDKIEEAQRSREQQRNPPTA